MIQVSTLNQIKREQHIEKDKLEKELKRAATIVNFSDFEQRKDSSLFESGSTINPLYNSSKTPK